MGCIDRSKVSTPASFPGKKTMSDAKHGAGKGKMSSAHGCTSGNPSKGMSNAGGRIGAGKARFSSGIKSPGGPKKVG